jgi:anti-sigma B factor antagonist
MTFISSSGVLDRDRIADDVSVVRLDGVLQAPIDDELIERVHELLVRGQRHILLDLAAVSDLDAAGVGELVRVHNLAAAANGEVRIVHPEPKTRELLGRLGLLTVLNVELD